MLSKENNRLIYKMGQETIWIEPWGKDGLRVRASKEAKMDSNNWALEEKPDGFEAEIEIQEVMLSYSWKPEESKKSYEASIKNGKISAKINAEGWISFYNQDGKPVLEEYWRTRERIDRYCTPLQIAAREWKPILGTGDYEFIQRFEAYPDEKIFGMGQYQDSLLNKKGASLELAHRNSQASIPFMVSSRGYGFLWNNPAIGRATFSTNKTEWTAESMKKSDYYITVGDTPAEIEENYVNVTGKVPMMPEYGMGFWQCKLRYRTQDEILKIAGRYHDLGIPLDVIVVDFFHWTKQGDFKFEPRDFPNPKAMVDKLKAMGVELMVSVWPTVDKRSENYVEMAENGYLVSTDRGLDIHMNWMGETVFFDATNEAARKFVWERCKENYYDYGIRIFWLDEAEPEFGPYHFDNYRYSLGPVLQCANIYPALYTKGYYDGMTSQGQEKVMNLARCAWAGSQKYGALVWSGDVGSTFRTLREQIQIGLNMGLAGIAWWTTDIGGFLGGDVTSPSFRELLLRWFAFGAFSPVFRLHGDREPHIEPSPRVIDDVIQMNTGADNEIWSYGEDNQKIMESFIYMRERLRDYIRDCMREAHEKGKPVMRTLFYEFPEDEEAWTCEDSYLFGPDILVAPVYEEGKRERQVYLPIGAKWQDPKTKKIYDGGQTIVLEAPLETIPLLIRDCRPLPIYED